MRDGGLKAGRGSVRPIVVLSMAGFCSMASLRVGEPLLPEIAAEFGTTAGAASIIATAFTLAYGLCQVIHGPLGDRVGKYRVVATAMALATVIVAATALADSLSALAWLRLAAGAATAAAIPLSLAYIGDIVPYERRQQVLARYLAGTIMGMLFGQVAGGIIMELAGWRSVFLILGAVYGLVTLLLFLELASPRVDRRTTGAPIRVSRIFVQYTAILVQSYPRRVLVAVFLEGFFLYGGLAYIGAFLRHGFALDYGTIGLLLGGFGIGGLCYSLTARPIIRWLGERGMVRVGSVALLIGFGAMASLSLWWTSALANFVLGFGFFLFHNTLQTNATQMVPGARGAAVALFAFSLFLGQAAGVAVLGPVVDNMGYPPAFVFCGAGLVLLGWWFAARPKEPVG